MAKQRRIYDGSNVPQTKAWGGVPQARYLPAEMAEAVLDPIAEGPEKYESATVIACSPYPRALDRYPTTFTQIFCTRDDEGHWKPA